MKNILEHGWIERLDRRIAMDKGLKELFELLHEEAEKKYPKHQRRINLLKMKKKTKMKPIILPFYIESEKIWK